MPGREFLRSEPRSLHRNRGSDRSNDRCLSLLGRRGQDRLEGALALAIEVLVQVRGVELDLGATLGHFDLCGPQDRIDDDPTEVLVGPVAVEVSAREAEAAAAVL